jgi:hypothetical protein
MDLYEPLHIERPMVAVPTVPGAIPRVYQEGASFADKSELRRLAEAPGRPGAPAPATASGGEKARIAGGRGLTAKSVAPEMDAAAGTGISAEDMAMYGAAAAASAGEIGEVFQYQLKEPVSVSRQHSAMLPILSSGIDGRRVSIYNRADGLDHPMRGVELKNSTGLQLMPGPISVFDGAAYAGDAQIGHITTNDKRLLAYAVDLDVTAIVKEDNASTVRKIRIVNGMLEQTSKQVYSIAYAFSNKDAKRARTILVEQQKMPGWTLVEPKKPADETQNLYRFEASLAPADAGKIDVVQERTDYQSFAVTGYDLNTLLAYAKSGKVSQEVVDAVRKAADMQAAINATQQRLQLLDQERSSIGEDQARIRQNMVSVAKDTELYRRYTGKLNEQESRLEAVRDEREKLVGVLTRQQQELEAYIRGLNVE